MIASRASRKIVLVPILKKWTEMRYAANKYHDLSQAIIRSNVSTKELSERSEVTLKDERPTSNIECPTSNKKQTPNEKQRFRNIWLLFFRPPTSGF
jgi:hypothetical protein